MTRIYTRSGDEGETGLADGSRTGKDSLRIEAIGTVDECNAQVGLLLSHLQRTDELWPVLERVQHQLFDLGATLAAAEPTLTLADIDYLENQIDNISARLKPLQQFILPGGNMPASIAHVTRTVCRRAERCVIALDKSEPLPGELRRYINRLSDLFFVIARALAARDSDDIPWVPNSERT